MVTTSRARETVFSLKLAHSVPIEHPLHLQLSEASRRIRVDSGGRVDLEIFPLDQLGAQPDTLSQVRSGAVEFMAVSGLVLSSFVPSIAIGATPFAFKDLRNVWRALDGALGQFVREEIERSGTLIAIATVFDSGFRQITTSRRTVEAVADLDGLRIRVPSSALSLSLFRALGASPTVTTTGEIYSALQNGVVDGQENPLALIWHFRLYEVQRHCAVTNHMWDGLWLVGNRAKFNLLPEELRTLVTRHLNEAAIAEREDLVALNAALQQKLVDKGVRFTRPAMEPFHQRLRTAKFYDDWRSKFPPVAWSRLESVVGPL